MRVLLICLLASLVVAAAPPPRLGPSVHEATCETDRVVFLTNPPTQGDDVKELQARLKELGMYTGPIDGSYDRDTWKAVSELQRGYGMEGDGVVGPETWFALGGEESASSSGASALPPPAMPITIEISRDRATLTVFSAGKLYWTFAVAVGESDTPSPVGEWKVANKGIHWGGGFGTRWLGLDVPWGTYGIHGTNKPWSVGRRASHGCFRMHNASVESLYRWIPQGTPVSVTSSRLDANVRETIRVGAMGQDVVGVQLALRRAGFEAGRADGRFGKGGSAAVRSMHAAFGLPTTGEVTQDTYTLLGLRKVALER